MTCLQGLTLAVTRPQQYAKPLADVLTAHGARVLIAPTLVLAPQDFTLDQRLTSADSIIFVSQAAVHYFFEKINQLPQRLDLSTLQVLAIGEKTAHALAQYGIAADYPRHCFNSENLLNLPVLSASNLQEKKIVIVRGGRGRDHLADVLKSRGGCVRYLDVYQRQAPDYLPLDFIQAVNDNSVDAVIVTSVASMVNLYDLLSHYNCQPRFQLCTTSARISQEAIAKQLSTRPLTARSADADMIVSVLMQGEKSE